MIDKYSHKEKCVVLNRTSLDLQELLRYCIFIIFIFIFKYAYIKIIASKYISLNNWNKQLLTLSNTIQQKITVFRAQEQE